jgi:hypothetical protein
MALGHLGISSEIGNLTTEKSAEASACRRFFTQCRDIAMRDMRVPFASHITTLALVKEAPNSEWDYAYRYPSDCLFFKRILSGARNDTSTTRVPYKITSDESGKIILSDKQVAECEYTRLIEDPLMWPDDFILAMSYLLASMMSARLTKGDGLKLGDRAMQMYDLLKHTSDSNADAEEQNDEAPEAESIRARE